MSTSLKLYHVDEIIDSMVKSLNDNEFTGMFKKAEEKLPVEPGLSLDAPSAPLPTPSEGLKDVVKQQPGGPIKLSPTPMKKLDTKPAVKVPVKPKYYDAHGVPVNKADCDLEEEKEENKEDKADDAKVAVAKNFTIKKLAELADALDANGFGTIADVIDETISVVQNQ